MPNIDIEFSQTVDATTRRMVDMDEAIVFFVTSLSKLAGGVIDPDDAKLFARQTLVGASSILRCHLE